MADAQPLITTAEDLGELVQRIADQPRVAFDTEFVSEHSYRPQLCLIQVAAGTVLAAIDPLAVSDLKPFWDVLTAPGRVTVVHAAREELLFCRAATGRRPAGLFDVQLAAGMVGLEYPAGYGNLIGRLLSVKSEKGETRTDWRRRPLSERQIEYALEDVRHLHSLHDILLERLNGLNRLGWFETEMAIWQDQIEASIGDDRWRRVSGSATLKGTAAQILRELWRWRETEAGRRNRPVRHVLRDDLLVELARRRSADPKQIRAVRGMERSDIGRLVPEISQAIQTALSAPQEDLPRPGRREPSPQITMLGQFLSAALASICRAQRVAASLVATATDVRDFVAWRLDEYDSRLPPPSLTLGWRADLVGNLFDDLLAGHASIRIADARSDHPLVVERVTPDPVSQPRQRRDVRPPRKRSKDSGEEA